MKRFVFILLMVVLMSGCYGAIEHENSTDSDETDFEIDTSDNNEQGENTMDARIITSEEFIQILREYGLDSRIRDFDDLDIDDFILKYKITEEIMLELVNDEVGLSRLIDWYVKSLPEWEEEKKLSPYLVRKLQYVDSTTEEFRKFIEEYFVVLDLKYELVGFGDNDAASYVVEKGVGAINFTFCQTHMSADLELSKGEMDDAENYMVKLYSGEMSYYTNIYYSKNAKYLMFLYGNAELDFGERFHLIQTFCEMDD